jgi:prepilin signal peptidase PulO-like enzyme (type II secretory pathway)
MSSASTEATVLDREAPLLRRPLPVAMAAPILAALAFASNPLWGRAAIAAGMAVVLVVITATDIERRIIPNKVVLPAAALVLIADMALLPGRAAEFLLAAVGAAAAFLLLNVVNRGAMGMGDVKLALLLGAGLGASVVGAIMIAFLAVFPFALATVIRGGLKARKQTLPFGPFLAFGALFVLIVPHLTG